MLRAVSIGIFAGLWMTGLAAAQTLPSGNQAPASPDTPNAEPSTESGPSQSPPAASAAPASSGDAVNRQSATSTPAAPPSPPVPPASMPSSPPQPMPLERVPVTAPPPRASAQTAMVSPIVVTANKIPKPQTEVTQSFRTLDEDEIVLRPSNQRNASELIRHEPGVFVSPLSRNDANWGSYGGLGPKYNTYLLDGLTIDAFVDTMSLDPWAFERVQSQRGPVSVMYSNYLSSDFAGQQSPLAGTTNGRRPTFRAVTTIKKWRTPCDTR